VHNAQVCYFKKKKKKRKKKAQEKSESKGKKKHDKKKVQGKKKKSYWPSKLTPGGQFHPIHEIPWNPSFIPWFPLDHIGPEWFSTRRRTIHPLDAWTPVSIRSHWARVIHSTAHHPSTRCLNLNLSQAKSISCQLGNNCHRDWNSQIKKFLNLPGSPPSTKHTTGNGQWLEEFSKHCPHRQTPCLL